MAVIYLIRHGQASFGKQNYDQLSDKGYRQSEVLGQYLSSKLDKFDQVYLGSMQRHAQTAERCLACFEHGHQSIVDEAWNEYDYQNILAVHEPQLANPQSTAEFLSQYQNPQQEFEKIFVAAVQRWMGCKDATGYSESWANFKSRVLKGFEKIKPQSERNQVIAVFTSGGPISLITQQLLAIPEQEMMRLNWTLVNAGVTKVVSTSNRTFVSTLNDHNYFDSSPDLISYR